MSEHPFPLPRGLESDWTARDWQAAANHYHYEIMSVDRVNDANYRPLLSLLEAAFNHASRRAKAARQAA